MTTNTSKSFARALLEGKCVSLVPEIAIPNGKLSVYTVYVCSKCPLYYRSDHNGYCPKCGGYLDAAICNEEYYDKALD